jgi:Rrf2 family protein
MLRPSRRLIATLEAVLDIASNEAGRPVQSKDIMRRQSIPERYLEPVMQRLVHAGLLAGVRGPRGGYRLARERRRIKLAEIVRLVEAMDRENADELSALGERVIRPLLEELGRELDAKLETITLEDLCRRAEASGIESEARARLDFSI